jgi:hypothetical protein
MATASPDGLLDISHLQHVPRRLGPVHGCRADPHRPCGPCHRFRARPDRMALRRSLSHRAGDSGTHCVGAGKPAIKVEGTNDNAAARSELKQGRLDAAARGGETVPYMSVLEHGVYKSIGVPFGAVLAAFKKLLANGAYTAIIAKWNAEQCRRSCDRQWRPDNAVNQPIITNYYQLVTMINSGKVYGTVGGLREIIPTR